MPRPLPLSDFRARRRKLLPSDFVFSPERQEKATDQIGPRTWNHIVGLPDDVAIRTTNHHGTEIKNLNEFQSIWTDLSKPTDMMTTVLLDAHDDFQAALYNAMTGYYRLSVTATRAALEALAIGAWCQTSAKRDDFKKWRRGKMKLEFNNACQGLNATAAPLENYLAAKCGDNLFRIRDTKAGINAGFVRVSSETYQNMPTADPSLLTVQSGEATDPSTSQKRSIMPHRCKLRSSASQSSS